MARIELRTDAIEFLGGNTNHYKLYLHKDKYGRVSKLILRAWDSDYKDLSREILATMEDTHEPG